MLQHLKLKQAKQYAGVAPPPPLITWRTQGSIERISGYCPLDLFSGDAPRVAAAVRGLLDCAQNNLRVYVCANADLEVSVPATQRSPAGRARAIVLFNRTPGSACGPGG